MLPFTLTGSMVIDSLLSVKLSRSIIFVKKTANLPLESKSSKTKFNQIVVRTLSFFSVCYYCCEAVSRAELYCSALGFFFTIQRIWIVLGRCLFNDSKRSIGEVLFLINFVQVKFEAVSERREKIWSDFVAEQNEEWSEKSVVFCLYRCFLESEKLSCEKKLSERNFLFTCGILKQFFQFFLVMRCDYDFVLILGWFW